MSHLPTSHDRKRFVFGAYVQHKPPIWTPSPHVRQMAQVWYDHTLTGPEVRDLLVSERGYPSDITVF